MVCVAGEGQGTLEIWDHVGGGDKPDKKTLKIAQSVQVSELVHRVTKLCEYKIGSVVLILQWERNQVDLADVGGDLSLAEIGVDFTSGTTYRLLITKWASSPSSSEGDEQVKLNEKDTRTLTDVGVDLSSPNSTVMLFVTEPSDSPTTTDPPKEDRRRRIHLDYEESEDQMEVSVNHKFLPRPRSGINVGVKRWTKNWDVTRKYENDEQGNEDVDPNRRNEHTYVGLVNQAMTCYLNSLIQALYMTPEFRNALYNWEYINGSEKDENKSIPYQLQKLFLNLQTSSKNAIETTSLTKSFGWDSTEAWQQHDIQELCRVMFDALEQKFKNTEQADLINRLYEGKMIDYVKCLECSTEKSREDTFLDIPLPVRPFGSNVAYNSVEEALNAFVQPETLDGTNQYHCDTCSKKCDAHKGLKFTKFPYLLTLHLKRFDFDYNTFHRIKLNDEVTFPDVLNLNSFIPSSESEDSPCAEEDAGVKCEDTNSTAEISVPLDEKPCDAAMSVSENSTNHDQDDDSGIDLSNGPSTSSSSTHNHDNEKNRGNRVESKGPYEYELFSIMIHSGSASGGHYYAYIKDFRTGEWLCFNDQNVSPITYDDIQKTYGGGPTRAYYSGVYSSSTNAYMLMYRQIDNTRNTLPMQVKDFPKHLKELLSKMQDNQDMSNREYLKQMYRIRVFCDYPDKKIHSYTKVYCRHDETWSDLTDRAHLGLSFNNVVPRDQVRLVTYEESTGMIECSFEGREDETIRTILENRRDVVMEIREKNEQFKKYLPGGVLTKVFVVDVAKKEVVKGPIDVRGLLTQTVNDYKIQLGQIIDMDPKDISLIAPYPNNSNARLITNNESPLVNECFVSGDKIFVPTVFEHNNSNTSNSIEDKLDEVMDIFGRLISLNVDLSETSEEAIREMNIPTLADKNNEKVEEPPLTNGQAKVSPVAESPADSAKVKGIRVSEADKTCTDTTSPPCTQSESEDWHTPEQSNSEDSSLSYSDRTLVGEGEAGQGGGDASEDDDYPLAGVDHELFHQTEQESWEIEDPRDYYFRATPHPDKVVRVLLDNRMCLGKLKKLLEPHVGVPIEYFKVFRQSDAENECSRLTLGLSHLKDGEILYVKLGRALGRGEVKLKLYQLLLDSELEPYRFLTEWIISKDATIGQAKKEILVELKRKFGIDIPFERCRLRKKNYRTAAKVFLDDQKIKDLTTLSWPFEVIVQELQGKEPVTDPNDVAVFVRRCPTTTGPEPIQELVVSGKSLAEVRENLSKLSGIPEENIEIAKARSSLPVLTREIPQMTSDWSQQSTTPDNCPEFTLEDGVIIYYRDWTKIPEFHFEEFHSKKKTGMLGISSSSRYSPRRERALKIYIDDK